SRMTPEMLECLTLKVLKILRRNHPVKILKLKPAHKKSHAGRDFKYRFKRRLSRFEINSSVCSVFPFRAFSSWVAFRVLKVFFTSTDCVQFTRLYSVLNQIILHSICSAL